MDFRVDLALEGLLEYLKEGEPEGAALEMVLAGLSRSGRLKEASELLLEAINNKWIGIVPLEKSTAILAAMSMKCAKEDDYAREFVEVKSLERSVRDLDFFCQDSFDRYVISIRYRATASELFLCGAWHAETRFDRPSPPS